VLAEIAWPRARMQLMFDDSASERHLGAGAIEIRSRNEEKAGAPGLLIDRVRLTLVPAYPDLWPCLPEWISSPVEVLTWRRLIAYYVRFFIHLESRRVTLAGITQDPRKPGWSKSLETQPTVTWARSAIFAICCMIVVPSSAPRSIRC